MSDPVIENVDEPPKKSPWSTASAQTVGTSRRMAWGFLAGVILVVFAAGFIAAVALAPQLGRIGKTDEPVAPVVAEAPTPALASPPAPVPMPAPSPPAP